LAGRYLLTPIFRIVGNAGAREAMIATALLIVLGAGYLMHLAGLSMAMGAFIAGVMLAESSYRHELEADIEPFRGLLLGLFFIAIGMSLELAVIFDEWLVVLVAVPILMLVKAAIIFLLCRLFGNEQDVSIRTALVLPQGGEFGFVLFSAAAALGIFDTQTASLLIVIVTLSMALTPITVMLGAILERNAAVEEMDENFDDADESPDVLLIGFSRFGQIAAQILLAGGSRVTIIDHDPERVRAAGRFGFRIYFGDGTRKELLEAAGIRRARIIAICTNKKEVTDKIVDLIQSTYPGTHLFVRAYDRAHTLELRAKGVDYELRETFESGLVFGGKTLEALGTSDALATEIVDDVRKRDSERLRVQATDGITAGAHMVHTKPVTPEPLSKPPKEGKIVNFDADHDPSEKNSDAAE
ncbi:MAG: cation:proton antiporter, partial [Pseudomonadota bacterium]